MKLCTAGLEQWMQKFFYRLGFSIGGHPKTYIVVMLTLSAASCLGYLRFQEFNDARKIFNAWDSPSREEARVVESFLGENKTVHNVQILIQSRNHSNLLERDHRRQLMHCIHDILKVVAVKSENGTYVTYQNMCSPYCEKPNALIALLNVYEQNLTKLESQITYPVTVLLGRRLFIAEHVFDVKLKRNQFLEGFETVMLNLFVVHSDVATMNLWEEAIVQLLYETEKYPLLNTKIGSDNEIAKEVKKMGDDVAPLFGISLPLLMAFLVLCSLRYNSNESKPIETLLGGAVPALAAIVTVGIVSGCGLAFQSIVVSTLFLILAIGFDDVFIMLAAWHRTRKIDDVKVRIAQTIQHSGVSMTVTTVTNIVSFGIGVASTTPSLQTFSIYSVAASFIVFLYQLILFPSFLTLSAHRESEDHNPQSKVPEKIAWIKNVSLFHDLFFKWLAELVVKTSIAFIVILSLFVYWSFAIYGIYVSETSISIKTLAQPSSRIAQFAYEHDRIAETVQQAAIVVQTPGDLRNATRLKMVHQMLKGYERTKFAFGPQSTFCWLRDFQNDVGSYWEQNEEGTSMLSYNDLPFWLESNPLWMPTLKYNETLCSDNKPGCVRSFICSTGWVNLTSDEDVYKHLLVDYRKIASQFPELNVVTYTERSDFADQTQSLRASLWQTLAAELICMAISFIFFIPETTSIISALFSVLSVNLGVFGFLSWWGIGINPLSMAALLMSIGFSVDISAHISYHYYEAHAKTAFGKIEESFLSIGWPTTQGALSTLLAMSPVILKPSYLSEVFLKTVFLVTTFGVLHGLVVLPVLLNLFDSLFRKTKKPTLAGVKSGIVPTITNTKV